MAKIIAISGEIGWDVWPDAIRAQIAEAKDNEPIDFQISSPGGYVYDGLEIFNLIKQYPGETTTTAIGMAASMASVLLMAGDKKRAYSNAIFMIHNARAYSGGDQNAHRKLANILEGMSNMLASEYVKQSGKDRKEIKSLMDEETYLFGEDILEAGFVDEIIDIEDEIDAEAKENTILDAMVKVESLDKKLREQPEKFENMDKIAACLPQNKGANDPPKRESAQNQPKPEEKMNWDEFVTQPENKTRIDALVSDAKKEGRESAKEEFEGKSKRIGNILGSDEYSKNPKAKKLSIKALNNEISMEAFEVGIALLDEDEEESNSEVAQSEQGEDTNTTQNVSNPDKPKSVEDIKDLVASMKPKQPKV